MVKHAYLQICYLIFYFNRGVSLIVPEIPSVTQLRSHCDNQNFAIILKNN